MEILERRIDVLAFVVGHLLVLFSTSLLDEMEQAEKIRGGFRSISSRLDASESVQTDSRGGRGTASQTDA